MEYVKIVLLDVIMTAYQYTGTAIICAVLIMIVLTYAKKDGLKAVISEFLRNVKTRAEFRRRLLLFFFIFLILQRTLLGRTIWGNPLENVIGNWGLHVKDGKINFELFENIIMFVPFTFMVFISSSKRKLRFYPSKIVRSFSRSGILLYSVYISFSFSFCIELSQLFFKLGTFQLSDLFFNTLGGIIGSILYIIIWKLGKKRY